MRNFLIALAVVLVLVVGFFILNDNTEEVNKEYPGIVYTIDGSVKEEIVINLEGEYSKSYFDEPGFTGTFEIEGKEIYFVTELTDIEKQNGKMVVIIHDNQTDIGLLTGAISFSNDFKEIIGSISKNDEITYYFGAPGENLSEILEIEIH
ncbi:hypothetical protein [Natranaerobius trueperi]|uniref:Uncharacterized protein n=1 Tax=Natranaerobius trueperi TaxID=759412 RepID=A0A226BXF6_9FIRM|nr:hypothetical protein [Natranaerobius trueperi]OWZ82797.1 hypothetical protein CDO51_12165 [Natranaerobius trueperi]